MSAITNTELREKCAEIQVKLGIDDLDWFIMFGNEKGLYGLIQAYSEQPDAKERPTSPVERGE